jgi:glycosyltransferase involved in cell wall biosynthesis
MQSIAIYCGPLWEQWAASDIDATGLPGLETAVVRAADALAALGCGVTVYGECPAERRGDVRYAHWKEFDPGEPRDAVIGCRNPRDLTGVGPDTATVMWIHDVDWGNQLTPRRARHVDAVVAVSNWHAEHLRRRYPFLAERLVATRNGIDPAAFSAKPPARRAPVVLSTSAPDRGLDMLLHIWPYVRRFVPGAVLRCAWSGMYARLGDHFPSIGRYMEQITPLFDQPGVEVLGSLGQRELAVQLGSVSAWVNPSWLSPSGRRWMETSCISAMEAQAAGAVVVASNWGGLTDTVEAGLLLGEPDGFDAPDPHEWVTAIVEALTNDGLRDMAFANAEPFAQRHSWDGVAQHLLAIVAEVETTRPLGSAARLSAA